MGTEKRKGLGGVSSTPGPGTYQSNLVEQRNYRFAYGSRLKDSALQNGPGPGAYDPSLNQVRDKGPQYVFGRGGRSELAGKNGMPGPGQYDTVPRTGGAVIGFGTGVRTSNKASDTPGPGYYNLPKVTGHLANYYPQDSKWKDS